MPQTNSGPPYTIGKDDLNDADLYRLNRLLRLLWDQITVLQDQVKTLQEQQATTFATNSLGGGSAALGANCPAAVPAAPYTWISETSRDGTTVFIPGWK